MLSGCKARFCDPAADTIQQKTPYSDDLSPARQQAPWLRNPAEQQLLLLDAPASAA
jgi:hypothetical protein